jgi:hypothetical protein
MPQPTLFLNTENGITVKCKANKEMVHVILCEARGGTAVSEPMDRTREPWFPLLTRSSIVKATL